MSADTSVTAQTGADPASARSTAALEAEAAQAERDLEEVRRGAAELLLPKPGDRHDGRVVRASGTLPFSGAPFVLVRHRGRQQLAAIRSAQFEAKKERREATQADQFVHLAARVAYLDLGDGLVQAKLDDVLDLDGEDFEALVDPLLPTGSRGEAGPDLPPSPSS